MRRGKHPSVERPIMRSLSRTAVLFCSVLLVLQNANAAPKRDGQVTGSIISASGNPLSGVAIQIIREIRKGETADIVHSDNRGIFKFLHLAPGTYHLQVSHDGFSPVTTAGFSVDPGKKISWDIILNNDPRNKPIDNIMNVPSAIRHIFRKNPSNSESEQDAYSRSASFKRSIAMNFSSNSSRNGDYLTDSPSNQKGIVNFAFAEPLSSHRRFIFSGQSAIGNNSLWRIRNTYNYRPDKDHDLRVSLGFEQMDVNNRSSRIPALFASQYPYYQQGVAKYALGFEGRSKLINFLTINYALEFSRLHYMTDQSFVLPSFQVLMTFSKKWNFRTSILSHRVSDTDSIKLSDGEILNLSDPYTINVTGNSIRISHIRHSEVAVQRIISANSSVEFAAFRGQTLVSGVPLMPQTNLTLEEPFKIIEMNGGYPALRAARVTLNRKLTNHLDTSVSYICGKAAGISAGNESLTGSQLADNLQKYLHRRYQHSITGRVTATIPVTKTAVVATMRWNSDTPLVPLDWFTDSMDIGTKSINFQIRQTVPLPNLLGPASNWGMLFEFRNMLNQGRGTYSASDGEIGLNRYPRSVHYGINLNF
jgi:hypothetical protein